MIGTISEYSARRSDLHDAYMAMLDVARHRDLVGIPTTHQGKLGAVEGLAHELAHQLEAGREFELRIRETGEEEANEHEASTLRIEVAALAALGVLVSFRRLWRDANWRGQRPALTRTRRALSDRERKCVAAFVRIVAQRSGQAAGQLT